MKRYQHYINGVWTDPDSGEWFDTENPYTGEVWAKISRGNAADMDRAVAAAKQAFDEDLDSSDVINITRETTAAYKDWSGYEEQLGPHGAQAYAEVEEAEFQFSANERE